MGRKPKSFDLDASLLSFIRAPVLRVVSMSLACWGLIVLATLEPQLLGDAGTSAAEKIDPADVQRVVLVLDVSPSMNIVDAGADQKLRRRDRVLEVVEGILSRIALSRTRSRQHAAGLVV